LHLRFEPTFASVVSPEPISDSTTFSASTVAAAGDTKLNSLRWRLHGSPEQT
jgi:hypothetical protein